MLDVRFSITEKIVINKSSKEVFSFISDFKNWQKWSPWYVLEPNSEVEISGNSSGAGSVLRWRGDVIGEGQMTLQDAIDKKSVKLQIEFFKPWKSVSPVVWDLNELGPEKCEFKWTMQGQLPFFLFFMKKQMQAWIGNDFQRGLKMVKSVLEDGQVKAQSEMLGIGDKSGFYFVAKRRSCAIADLGPMMESDFGAMMAKVKKQEWPEPKMALSFTDEFNFVTGQCEYRACFAYEKPFANLEQGFESGEVPAHKALRVLHKGDYQHLGNSWGMAMAHQKAKKLKLNKKIAVYEVYLTTPDQVSVIDLKTEVVIPIV